MNNFICNYDLEFIHPSRSSLVKLIKNNSSDSGIVFSSSPRKSKSDKFYSVKASVSCEESGTFIFTDIIKDLTERINLLEIGGSFIDNIGRGYVDSLCQKQYTKYY